MTRVWPEKITEFFLRFRRILAWAVFLAVPLFALFLFRIRFENSLESFISPKDPDRKYYQEFKKEFGDDQIIILVIPMSHVFTAENLQHIQELTESMEAIPGISKIRSITNAQNIIGSDEGFEVKSFVEKVPDQKEVLDQLKREGIANPLYQLDLISLDGAIASFTIEAR